jgi:hypothetical protein
MYTKQQASQVRQDFYTRFGQYMSPILSADGMPQNWLNYKTGVRSIFIRMDTPNRGASVGLVLSHSDPALRLQAFQQMQALRTVFNEMVGPDWIWEAETNNTTGQPISRIYTSIVVVSVLNQADWPALISFFKPALIALDEFWQFAKIQFEA